MNKTDQKKKKSMSLWRFYPSGGDQKETRLISVSLADWTAVWFGGRIKPVRASGIEEVAGRC